jgi:hypothetical protein
LYYWRGYRLPNQALDLTGDGRSGSDKLKQGIARTPQLGLTVIFFRKRHKVLIQLHWQYIKKGKTIKTEIKAQKEIKSNDDMREFIRDTIEAYPTPANVGWLACNEKSKYFAFTLIKSGDTSGT